MLKVLVCVCAAMVVLSAFVKAADARTYSLGGMEVIALADTDPRATRPDNPGLLVGLRPEDAARYLSRPGSMNNSVNCFIVKNGREVILFDTGTGGGGLLPASLAAAGISPDAVDAVVITHFHGDHIGGLVRDGQAVFPRARLMVPRLEVEANPQAAMTFMAAYAGRLLTFEWNHPVADGVMAVDAHGHTPGHTVFLIDNNGRDKLMIAGDLVHFGAIQLPVPEVAVTYDSDPANAVASRKRLFDKAAGEGYAIASMHLPFPGFGTLRKEGTGYVFTGR